jgi:hypothetical protein
MTIPGFTAEAAFQLSRVPNRTRGGAAQSLPRMVVPALTACQVQCRSDCHELFYDCVVECFGNSICEYRCRNAYAVCVARCDAECRKGIG